jgi:HAD superfamily hydrolase (TIGR01509 family)
MGMPMRPRPSSLPVPHAVVFDLDGTLVDTVGTRVQAWMAAFPDFGIEPDPAFLAPLMGSDGHLLARMVAEHAGVSLQPGVDEDIDRVAGQHFSELNRHPRPLEGVADVVAWLDRRGLPWAIATSSRPDEALASVAALGLARPPVVVDGSDVEHAKPAPDLLLKAAHVLAVDADGTWYVGDSRWDMLAARAAGMTAVGVTTGATSAPELVEAGASVTFDSLAGLLDHLRIAGTEPAPGAGEPAPGPDAPAPGGPVRR